MKRPTFSIPIMNSEGEIFELDVQIIRCCTTLKTMLDDLDIFEQEDVNDFVIPLANINAPILRMIIKWLNHEFVQPYWKGITNEMKEWDANFLRVHKETLVKLTVAAHFLGIDRLAEITRNTVAGMIKGKTDDEIQGILNVRTVNTSVELKEIERQILMYME
ncbi:unnamed protein product [Orchesella dallaii]|uniref:SKP1 component POZ domain-containing protein n=1 Tax=Orchesella dallaii TaxID=48710 RepID=A0ABP1RWN5_9HEXA